jgi:uncharacterized protein (DUF885 family)
MMPRPFWSSVLSGAFVLAFALPGAAQSPRPAPPRPAPPRPARLAELLAAEWQHELERSPTFASIHGDYRWNDRWDDRSLAALEAEYRRDREVLARLDAIPRDRLGPAEQINVDLFRREREWWIQAYELGWHFLPTDHMGGLPEGVRQPPGVQTAAQLAANLPFTKVKDYEDWLGRLRTFGPYVDQVIALMREGMRRKLIHSRIVLGRIPAQIDKLLVAPEKSEFYTPFQRWPASISAADRRRLSTAGAEAIRRQVTPALRRFRTFLVSEYIPAAPEAVGAWQWPRGRELYAYWVRRYTTTDLTPDQLHARGLAEVARLRAAMEKVKASTGFRGDLAAFFRYLRSDPRFYHRSGDDLLLHYRDLAKRIDPALIRLFRTLPRMPYAVEPTPANMAPDVTTGFYYPAAADGSRPGTYFVNLYRPETRPRWEMVPLTLHEAVPGHHFQTSLAAEQRGLPEFRRFGYYMAYGEGWGLYAETLADELGLLDDPYDRFGQLTYEMWRAVRLVVDTGMHARRWTRERALRYFLANSPRQELDVTNEIDRYIATPGQALAYKVGQLKLRELRSRAERRLGARFDVRAFHDAVLLEGTLPLDILERRIDAWIARQARSR